MPLPRQAPTGESRDSRMAGTHRRKPGFLEIPYPDNVFQTDEKFTGRQESEHCAWSRGFSQSAAFNRLKPGRLKLGRVLEESATTHHIRSRAPWLLLLFLLFFLLILLHIGQQGGDPAGAAELLAGNDHQDG